jgi:hypothetical protein
MNLSLQYQQRETEFFDRIYSQLLGQTQQLNIPLSAGGPSNSSSGVV